MTPRGEGMSMLARTFARNRLQKLPPRIFLILALVLGGCADIRKDHETELSHELGNAVASVLIARGLLGAGWEPNIYLDGAPRCPLEDKTYCIVNVQPGTYQLEVRRARLSYLKPMAMTVNAPGNTMTYVRIDSKVDSAVPLIVPGLVVGVAGKGTILFSPVSKEEFLKMRPQMDRVQSK
jgi:hypothetical protein